jgi:polyribonucleotide nucleotidyltransferase
MVEGEAKEVEESVLLEAFAAAHEQIKKIVALQKELAAEAGKEKFAVEAPEISEELYEDVKKLAYDRQAELVATILSKQERAQKNKELKKEVLEALAEKYPDSETDIKKILHDMEKELMRKQILEEGKRLDGRALTEIRPIAIELGLLKMTHGSALFTRGETQSLMTLTLGTKADEQIVDGLQEEYKKRFLLHYNFPPFSVGEVGRYGAPGRREIGHGNLAERALKNVLPPENEFPYTIRLISDILESNGSSSMATVCSGSLALMDGGVPVRCAVAGVAMGLIMEGEKYRILTDISGNEDHLGDMDFKVAGSSKGVTAIQMDIKIKGLSFEIMKEALAQAKEARFFILDKMNSVIAEPRKSLSPYAPRLLQFPISVDKIGTVIGPGGKVIQKIQKDFGVEVFIEEDGTVNIASTNSEGALQAKEFIKSIVAEPEVGKDYLGKVIKLTDFGAFIEILPGVQGLLHISQIDNVRVNKVNDYFKEGDTVKVRIMKMENGKISLSRKAILNSKEAKREDKKEEK